MSTNRLNGHTNGHANGKPSPAAPTWDDLEDAGEVIAGELRKELRAGILEAGRAVHDHLLKQLRAKSVTPDDLRAAVRQARDEVNAGLRTDIPLEVGKVIERELAKYIGKLQEGFEAHLAEQLEEHRSDLELRQAAHEAELLEWTERVEEHMRRREQQLLETVKAVLQGSVAPIVNLPPIELPQPAAPVVNVTVPRRKVVKHLEYDQAGRPAIIREEEVDAGGDERK